MGKYTVYMHTNKINSKVYIGITCTSVAKRWGNNGNQYKGQRFYNSILKYGWNSFVHDIVKENTTEKDAKKIENRLILQHRSNEREYGYNLTTGGEHVVHTEETKRKIGQKNTGKIKTSETRDKISTGRKGKCCGEDHPKFGKIGVDAPMFGRISGNHPVSKKIVNLNTMKIFNSIRDASKYFSVSYSGISKCCRGLFKFSGTWGENGEPLLWVNYNEYTKLTKEDIKQRINNMRFVGKTVKVICLDTEVVFERLDDAACFYSVNPSNITNCCKGRQKAAGRNLENGKTVHWMYYEEYLKLQAII